MDDTAIFITFAPTRDAVLDEPIGIDLKMFLDKCGFGNYPVVSVLDDYCTTANKQQKTDGLNSLKQSLYSISGYSNNETVVLFACGKAVDEILKKSTLADNQPIVQIPSLWTMYNKGSQPLEKDIYKIKLAIALHSIGFSSKVFKNVIRQLVDNSDYVIRRMKKGIVFDYPDYYNCTDCDKLTTEHVDWIKNRIESL